MKISSRIRNTSFILLGILVLVLKQNYTGPFSDLVYNYGSNFSVSFAIYFIGLLGFNSYSHPRLFAAGGALLAVQLFELTNGFGVMENVYDPWDYLANALGIALALGIDLIINQISTGKSADTNGNNERLEK